MKTKTLSLVLCIVMLCGLISACGSGGADIRDDVPVADISTAVDAVAGGGDGMVAAPESHVTSFMKMSAEDYSEYAVKLNSKGVNIDEYGIFKGKDSEQVKTIKAAVDTYLQLRKDTWIVEYMPEEFPKLENAEVKVVGNYVMYAILSDEAKSAGFAAFEDALKA